MATPRILSGIKPTGQPHIGNYFGMMRPAIEWQERGEAFYFIADYHALTTVFDPAKLRDYVRSVALDFWRAASILGARCSFARVMCRYTRSWPGCSAAWLRCRCSRIATLTRTTSRAA
jgi:hypothetical protein